MTCETPRMSLLLPLHGSIRSGASKTVVSTFLIHQLRRLHVNSAVCQSNCNVTPQRTQSQNPLPKSRDLYRASILPQRRTSPIQSRLCSSFASSTIVKMATDRDILPDEYGNVTLPINLSLTYNSVSSRQTTPSPSSTSKPASHGPTKAQSTSTSKSRNPSNKSHSTPSNSNSTQPP